MPIVIFKGRVLPEFSDITARDLPQMEFIETPYGDVLPHGLKIKYLFKIEHSRIEMNCDVEPFEEKMFSWVFNRAISTVRAVIDLFSYTTAISLDVILDTVTYPTGEEKKILLVNPHLEGLCTVLPVDKGNPAAAVQFGAILPMVVSEPQLHQPLRDLISGITYQNSAAIDCARAIEGIRQIFWLDVEEKKKGWELLRTNLNISEEYIKFVTKTSEAPRHGSTVYIDGPTIDTVTRRAWKIFNRFLVYRAGGSKPLRKHDFPIL